MPVKDTIRDPFVLTIFGASGDLAKLKIFPALYELLAQKKLPQEFYIVGYARTTLTKKAFQNSIRESIDRAFGNTVKKKVVTELLRHINYFKGEYRELVDFEKYHAFLEALTANTNTTHLAYFSVPPIVFEDIVRNLALSKKTAHEDIRLILEKPFGTSYQSARSLFHVISQYFSEDHIYLLDHYLGKSGVRSILNLRHTNRILSHMMRGNEIDNIQITKFESYGVEERAGYFDSVGIIKDMIQSHLLQLLSLVTMDIPVAKTAESLQRERLAVLSAIACPPKSGNVVLGQYKGYTKETGVATRSRSETFAAVRLFINREEWYNIPVYIRTGKSLYESHTYIVIELKKFAFQEDHEEPNRLVFELSPDERINLTLINKHEDVHRYQALTTSDSIACAIDGCLGEHATLILNVLHRERMHFVSFQEILAAWNIIDQIEHDIKRKKIVLNTYEKGSEGPKAQHTLTSMDGYDWYDLHEY